MYKKEVIGIIINVYLIHVITHLLILQNIFSATEVNQKNF